MDPDQHEHGKPYRDPWGNDGLISDLEHLVHGIIIMIFLYIIIVPGMYRFLLYFVDNFESVQ